MSAIDATGPWDAVTERAGSLSLSRVNRQGAHVVLRRVARQASRYDGQRPRGGRGAIGARRPSIAAHHHGRSA